ncbi:hypothetical protein M1M11_17920 [Pseudomonas azerbaijanoccidens]|uniref:hypothetical protein n=1 Tax=Pseudomonas azerbaijanoccidentalis TaxID=2842347 RepID=UPI00200B232F|nr:hypothetical protein [Pseudomonas azerbaijanoccidentalis]MCK8666765.1 hypothetical protein [Pseudomonas azerbaijanoccidentalis]
MKISELNRIEAIRNIRLKISLLKEISNRSDFSAEEYLPKTLRQFNNWDLSQNTLELRKSVAPINRNANDTLNKYPDIKSEVIASLHASTLARSKDSLCSRTDRVGKLKSEIKRLKAYIGVLESYTVSQKIELVRVNELFEGKVHSLNGAIAELKRKLKDANSN